MGYIRQCRILHKVICLANELDLGNLHGHGRTSVSYCWENKPVKTEGLIIWKMNLLGAESIRESINFILRNYRKIDAVI